MTSRERVLAAAGRRPSDRVPADYKAEAEVDRYMLEYLNLGSHEDLLRRLESDIRRLEPRYVGPPYRTFDGGVFEDYWGIRSKRLPAGRASYDMHVWTPLWDARSLEDLARHPWPTPDIFDYSVMRDQCDRAEGFAVMYEGADLFTRPCILRNMENVLVDMVERPEMAHFLFRKFTDFYCEDITRALEATAGGFDIYCEWSDYGTQRALLISVPMFREFIAPYLKRLIDVCHAGGVKFMAHSCGAIRPDHPRAHRPRRRHPRPDPGHGGGNGAGRAQARLRRQARLPRRHQHPADAAVRHAGRRAAGRARDASRRSARAAATSWPRPTTSAPTRRRRTSSRCTSPSCVLSKEGHTLPLAGSTVPVRATCANPRPDCLRGLGDWPERHVRFSPPERFSRASVCRR